MELSREVHGLEMLQKSTQQTKEALVDALKQVFGDGDEKDPNQMKILVRRIPILCTSVIQMHEDIADMKDNFKWGMRVIIGAVLVAVLKLVLIP